MPCLSTIQQWSGYPSQGSYPFVWYIPSPVGTQLSITLNFHHTILCQNPCHFKFHTPINDQIPVLVPQPGYSQVGLGTSPAITTFNTIYHMPNMCLISAPACFVKKSQPMP